MSAVAFPSKYRGASAGRPKASETAAIDAKIFADAKHTQDSAAPILPEAPKAESEPTTEQPKPIQDEAPILKEAPKAESTPSTEHPTPTIEQPKAAEKKATPSADKKIKPISCRFNSKIKEGDDDIEIAEDDAKISEDGPEEGLAWESIFDVPTTAFRSRKRKWLAVETYIDEANYVHGNYEDEQEPTYEQEEPDAKKLKLSASIDLDFFLDSDGMFREDQMMTFLAANGNLHDNLEEDWNTGTYTRLNMHNAVLTHEQVDALAWSLSKGLPLTSLKLSPGPENGPANYYLIESVIKGGETINVSG